ASSQQLKFTTSDSCDRIKDEFQFLQAQYHSLKLECDKLASEKSEMQRHYIMYYEMSYGLNIEMHKQAEIVKRLNGICAQVLPYLSQEHQQQVLGAIERAKQVTPPEMNSIIRQQLQAHQLSQLQGLALPMTPLPLCLSQPAGLPAVTSSSPQAVCDFVDALDLVGPNFALMDTFYNIDTAKPYRIQE
ncbi:amino-terminal enhancer of split-like, partial [Sinocyclocheilus rhinocerous]|uniref:amino-terminal enhancer of split-like n=1 Tax=Sinocyclocheilus rhinocerous TaxID=307959 RepID=UPI0007B8EB53